MQRYTRSLPSSDPAGEPVAPTSQVRVHFEELAPEQRRGGIEVVTLELEHRLRDKGVLVTRAATGDRLGMADRPDCVHVHGIWSPSLARRLAKWNAAGVPTLVSLHGMIEPWALNSKRWKKWLAWRVYQRALLNRASVLHATSASEVQQMRHLGLRAPHLLAPWGVSLPAAAPETARIGTPPLRTAVFVGRIYPVKGLPLLIQAWARVRPENWRMVIVGPDEDGHRAVLDRLIQQLGLGGAFDFTGPLDGQAKEEVVRQAELAIQPSCSENFGMAIGEALARGLPVLTTVATPWQSVADAGAGWCAPVSIDGIAEALRQATAQPKEQLQRMGERGRTLVAEEYSWDVCVERLTACYGWISGGSRGAPPPPLVAA